MKTLYDLLGVSCDADDEALNKAYRKAAKAYHPDLNAGDPNASRRFKQITTAIEILRDAKERAAYDQLLVRERQRRRLRQTHIVIANVGAAAAIVALVAGYALIRPAFSTSTTVSEASTMVSEAEDNAVQQLVAIGGEQGAPRAEPAGGDVERGRVEQGLAVVAVSEQLAAAEREPERRENEAARSEGDERPQAAERERPQTEPAAVLRVEQTCKHGSLGCGRTLREEPKTRPSRAMPEAARSATLARRAAPAPTQTAPNLLQRAGAGISGILQHCFL
jgi:curved DNA-binding protein CbpA